MEGDRVDPVENVSVIQPQAPPEVAPPRTTLTRASHFLLDNSKIFNLRSHYDKYRRYVDLNLNSMFTALVTLYSTVFASQWQHFKRFVDSFQIGNEDPKTHLARVYVSNWFIDLYAYNRIAIRSLSAEAYNERFEYEILPHSTDYDSFLSLLLGSIKPTPICLTSEYALYIPTLMRSADVRNRGWSSANPFDIQNFTYDTTMFEGLMMILRERRQWNISTVTTNTTGRPCWLFDWHENGNVCSWFPRDQNYNDDDVTLAYIIGVACTPKLAPRDNDEWRYVSALAAAYSDDAILAAGRLSARAFYGAYEVRTLERQADVSLDESIYLRFEDLVLQPAKKKLKRKSAASTSGALALISTPVDSASSTSAAEQEIVEIDPPTFSRVRIVDWCYYSRVIMFFEGHTRLAAHRLIVFGSA